MKHSTIAIAIGALAFSGIAACSTINTALTKAAATPAGQLFCAFQAGDGSTVTAAIIDAVASAVPGAGAVAVLVTNAAAADVQADCAAAAKNEGGSGGIPVSPPASTATVPQVAVVPVGTTAKPAS